MTKKYICEGCEYPCILEVENESSKPFICPYHEKNSGWHLLKEDQEMIQIECELFKPNGKWYTSELVSIPEDTSDWNIPNIVRDNRRVTDLIHVGKMRNGVPFLILADGGD